MMCHLVQQTDNLQKRGKHHTSKHKQLSHIAHSTRSHEINLLRLHTNKNMQTHGGTRQ